MRHDLFRHRRGQVSRVLIGNVKMGQRWEMRKGIVNVKRLTEGQAHEPDTAAARAATSALISGD